jgi:glyoxylase-like metal-dependent hydrolase (beta-lactamase superfamily II)
MIQSTRPARHLFLATTVGGAMLALAGCASAPAVDAQASVQAAQAAMGGTNLKTLRFAGTGSGGTFGQAWRPELPWPKLTYTSFSRVVDYDNAALREEFARTRAEPNGGGALPLIGTGEQRAVGLVQGNVAWNLAGTAAQAAPVALDGRIHDLWTTPHGVLKAALKNKATAVSRTMDGKSYTVVSFTEPGRFTASAWINSDNLVERIESRHPSPVLGDTDVVTTFTGYKDYSGVKFPSRISQIEGGSMVLDLQVTEVQAGVPTGFTAPDNVRSFAENVNVEKVADGVWFLAGGSHNSVAIEMKDHMILVESPLYDGRASAVIAATRKLNPAKPIRYVINSHHHFDHAGGLRTAAAEGITLVTSALAKPWYERVLANPNRISPDLLANSGRSATIEAVDGKRVFSDGTRTVEVQDIKDSVHAQGFMMVYLPAEKLLIEADAYTPGPPNAPAPAQPNGNNVNMARNVEAAKYDVARILPLHGRVATYAELRTAAGLK